jgi:hypothetical protein
MNNQRREPNTFLSHTHPELEIGGRFAAEAKHTIIGRDNPIPKYTHAAPWAETQLPDEPPLGYAIDDQEAVGTLQEIEQNLTTGATQHPPLPCLSEEAASPPATPPHSPHSVKGESGASSDHLRRRASATNFKRRI